jgi:hypothetical protein
MTKGKSDPATPWALRPIMVIPVRHDQQRYDTVGDYQTTDGGVSVLISKTSDWRHFVLVAIHELVEWSLTVQRRIPEATIDAFDIAFETNRQPGNEDEPGHDPRSPYRHEHRFAEVIERLLATELGVDWDEYDRAIMDL